MPYDPLGILDYIEDTALPTDLDDGDVGHNGHHEVLQDEHNKLAQALSRVSDGSAISPRARGADPTGGTPATEILEECVADMATGSTLVIDGQFATERELFFDGLVDCSVMFLGGSLKMADDTLTDANLIPLVRAAGCERLLLFKPTLDGNRDGQSDWTEWNPGLALGYRPDNTEDPNDQTIIEYPNIWNVAGDCIYIGGGCTETFINKGWLKDPNTGGSNNRRQGLAIVSAVGVYIDGVVFPATAGGFLPGRCAIDIEPNNANELIDEIYITNCRQYGSDWNFFLNLTGLGGVGDYGKVYARGNRSTRYWRVDPPEPLHTLEMSDNHTDEAYYIANVERFEWDHNSASGKDIDALAGALLLLSDAPQIKGAVDGGSLVKETGGSVTAAMIVEGAVKRLDVGGLLIGGGSAPQAMTKGIVLRAAGGVDPIEVDIRPCHFYAEGASMNPAIDTSGLLGTASALQIHVADDQHWIRGVTAPVDSVDKLLTAPVYRRFKASTTWDPGSIADGAVASVDVTYTPAGLLLTDGAVARLSSITAPGWFVSAQVASTNTIRVTILNKTGGAVDLASGTLSVVVTRMA